ncbi:glycosyltransferase [Rhizobium sp. LEGMi135b]
MTDFLHIQQQDRTTLLSICIVTYRPDLPVLRATLESLRVAVAHLSDTKTNIMIVDNSPSGSISDWLTENFQDLSFHLLAGHGNVGFARANNMVLDNVGDLHLVLNPDVVLSSDSLANAVQFLKQHPECGLLTPSAVGVDGVRQYLCKRYPAAFDLALRGFAPKRLRKLFKRRLNRYQMADMPDNEVFWDPPIVSGCFMLFRGEIFRNLNGFDPSYFLYFEDFDLSIRTAQVTRVAFLPTVKIIHGGGDAARKGFWHIGQFIRSAFVFYRKFGFRLF